MSCEKRYTTNNLYICGEIIPSDSSSYLDVKIWIVVPVGGRLTTSSNFIAIVLFADSHGSQGLFHYPPLPVSSSGIEGEAVIQDLGTFYDNDGINLYATINLKNNKPYKITIHNLNAGIGWDGNVNLRVKDLEINVCSSGSFFFSSPIQRFFNGSFYCIAGYLRNHDYESSPDMETWFNLKTIKECEERIKIEALANANK